MKHSIYLSIYPYPLTAEMDGAVSAAQKQFNTLTVSCKDELSTFLNSQQVFCNLICCYLREPEDLLKIEETCAAFPKLPCVVYGRVEEPEFYLELGKNGVRRCVPVSEHELLLQVLHELKERAAFRIDLRDFGIDVNECKNYWRQRFYDFILEEDNFLRYRTVGAVAKQLHTSDSTLVQVMRGECWLTPKQLLLCLRNYYAAYLLDTTHWSTRVIAERCGFRNEHQLYKSFRSKTGLTIKTFRTSFSWRDYPALYVETMKKGS